MYCMPDMHNIKRLDHINCYLKHNTNIEYFGIIKVLYHANNRTIVMIRNHCMLHFNFLSFFSDYSRVFYLYKTHGIRERAKKL